MPREPLPNRRPTVERRILQAYFELSELSAEGLSKELGIDRMVVESVIAEHELPPATGIALTTAVRKSRPLSDPVVKIYDSSMFESSVVATLDRHCMKRGLSREGLVNEIVADVLEGDLVDAVLDDGAADAP